MLLDELDKLDSDWRGNPAAALMEVLDPAHNHAFRDNYLEAEYDLSRVFFIATANDVDAIPATLYDRLEVIHLSGYTLPEKLSIARRHLLPRVARDTGLRRGDVRFGRGVLPAIVRGYTREAGVRELERALRRIDRKVARRHLEEGLAFPATVAAAELRGYLGEAHWLEAELPRAASVGESLGLAYTSDGGEVLTVEATLARGRGELVLTGQLGEVMQESASAAWGYLLSHAERDRGLAPLVGRSPFMTADGLDLSGQDVRVHVPEGAVPKDGPSAGLALAVAMLSALGGVPVKPRVAMTGEITLGGRILRVGGLKEKLLAAGRSGIRTVILPSSNRGTVEELPADLTDKLELVYVASFKDALPHVFGRRVFRERASKGQGKRVSGSMGAAGLCTITTTSTITRPPAPRRSRASTRAPASWNSTARSAGRSSAARTSSARCARSSTAGERCRKRRSDAGAVTRIRRAASQLEGRPSPRLRARADALQRPPREPGRAEGSAGAAPARYTLGSAAAGRPPCGPRACGTGRPCREPAAAELSGAAARRGSRQRPMTDPSSGTDYLQQTTRFEPAAVEARWMKHWLDEHLFHAEPDPDRPPYSIVIPPPNITGVLHMGHALNDTVQDVLTRYHRMLGENACWLVGTDHAGIATQNVVEKMLRKEGLTKEDLGREEFVARVWEWRREYGGTIIEQLKRLGSSCDYERERFTFDEGYVRAVTRVFVALYDKGYIHKDSYLVNWCPRCGTAISDLEVAYRDMPGTLNHIRYDVAGGGSVTIATTRPETMLGDTAVAVHPDDERYTDVVGKTAVLPLLGRELRIVADERVDPSFGTGALKITPAHDLTDFDIGRTHGLEAVQAIGQDGRITAAGGPYAGLEVEEAAARVTADLRALGALSQGRGLPAQRRHLRPLRHAHRAAHQRAVVHGHGRAQEARDGRGPRRQGQVHARALGPRLHRLDGQSAALVHQPAALVGTPAAGVVLPGRPPHGGRDRAAGLRHVRLHRAHARDRRAGHVVQLGALAVRHLRVAGPDRRPRLLLSDERAEHGARHHLPVGRAHDHDGSRVHGRHPVRRRLHPLGDPGAGRTAHEQEPRAPASTRSR